MSITADHRTDGLKRRFEFQSEIIYFYLKRTMDIIAALLILLLILPGMIVIAAMLLIVDGRPIFYSQTRIGKDGLPFRCYKFRSMSKSADADLASLLESSPEAKREWEATQKLADDPRVHRLGRFLRHSSIDETPQFWNVVKGDMSLVGPRPITQAELQRYGEHAPCYLALTPGITGLWQVSGRSSVTYEARIAMDVVYYRSRSLGGDMLILLKTFGVCMLGRGSA